MLPSRYRFITEKEFKVTAKGSVRGQIVVSFDKKVERIARILALETLNRPILTSHGTEYVVSVPPGTEEDWAVKYRALPGVISADVQRFYGLSED